MSTHGCIVTTVCAGFSSGCILATGSCWQHVKLRVNCGHNPGENHKGGMFPQ